MRAHGERTDVDSAFTMEIAQVSRRLRKFVGALGSFFDTSLQKVALVDFDSLSYSSFPKQSQ